MNFYYVKDCLFMRFHANLVKQSFFYSPNPNYHMKPAMNNRIFIVNTFRITYIFIYVKNKHFIFFKNKVKYYNNS